MSSISVAGDVSGAISIAAPSAAGSGVLTLPTGTDTLVGKATTDTLTNKSIAATQLTGTIAVGRLPAGAVLQVVNATYGTAVSSSTNVFADTGLTASITPSSVSSKILVLVTINDIEKVNNAYAGFKLVRNAADILTFSAEASYTASAPVNATGVSCNYLDSPASTSATTYKVQFKSTANNLGITIQASIVNSSQITLMEIAG